jgi:hypothetical protein
LPFSAAPPAGRHLPIKVPVFIDLLAETLAIHPALTGRECRVDIQRRRRFSEENLRQNPVTSRSSDLCLIVFVAQPIAETYGSLYEPGDALWRWRSFDRMNRLADLLEESAHARRRDKQHRDVALAAVPQRMFCVRWYLHQLARVVIAPSAIKPDGKPTGEHDHGLTIGVAMERHPCAWRDYGADDAVVISLRRCLDVDQRTQDVAHPGTRRLKNGLLTIHAF